MALFYRRIEYRNRSSDPSAVDALDLPRADQLQKALGIRGHLFAQSSVGLIVKLTPRAFQVTNTYPSSVSGTIIAELSLIHTAAHGTDPTYDLCDITVLQEITQCLSIVTACWGQLRPFLKWMKSNGLLIQDDNLSYLDTKSKSIPNSKSRETRLDRQGSFTISLQTDNLTAQDWELDSQSSQVQIIREAHQWTADEPSRESF